MLLSKTVFSVMKSMSLNVLSVKMDFTSTLLSNVLHVQLIVLDVPQIELAQLVNLDGLFLMLFLVVNASSVRVPVLLVLNNLGNV